MRVIASFLILYLIGLGILHAYRILFDDNSKKSFSLYLLLLIPVLLYLYTMTAYLGVDTFRQHVEPTMVIQAQLIAAGQPIYTALDAADRFSLQYGPTTYIFTALFLNFFDEYKLELENHIYREETKVYPYVVALEKALQTGKADEATMQQMNTYPIAEYEREHENVEEKLNDLKNLMIKYLPTVDDDRLCFRILRELFALEKELNEHARIEDLILVPKVMAMEIAIKNREK